jgi:hypothetical protein
MMDFFKSFLNGLKRERISIPKPTGVDLSPDVVEEIVERPSEPLLPEVPKDPLQKEKILKVINAFETGSLETDYSSLFFYNDGPNQMKQITLGRGFTEFGNLGKVVEYYSNAGGVFSDFFKRYIGRVGKQPSLRSDKDFVENLKKAGSDPLMRQAQDRVFEEKYWIPAKKFFDDNGFKEPLSMLVIFDSFVHSGSVLAFLRARFREFPPSKGGQEKKWIEEYVNVRHNWLATHSTVPVLRNTIYRTNCFKNCIKSGNWDLSKVVNANGILV